MNKAMGAILIWLALVGNAAAALLPYELVKDKSELKFIAIQNGAPVSGTFTEFDADIIFDYDYPETGKIKATVQTGSLKTSYKEVEQNVTSSAWLASEQFPTATFETTKISKIPSTWDYYAEGKLTLRGVTAPIVMNFQIEDFEDKAIAKGFATIKRNDYGVGEGQWATDDVVKNQVRVEFRIVANKLSERLEDK